jgi:hypothetical protein
MGVEAALDREVPGRRCVFPPPADAGKRAFGE